MRLTKRAVEAGIASIAALTLLTACSGGNADNNNGSNTDKNITLRYEMFSSNPDQIKLFKSMFAEFTKEDPAVTKVEIETVPVQDLTTKLTTELSSSDPPDAGWLQSLESKQFINAGALLDITKTLKTTKGYDFDDLIPKFQQYWRKDGKVYGVPFSTSPQILYYNADLFKAAGVKNPQEMIDAGTWDWDHFRKAAKAIKDTQNVPGYAIAVSNWATLVPLMYAYGATPWNTAGTQCQMDTPEMAKAMTVLHDMIYTDHSMPSPGQTANFWGGKAGTVTAFLSSNGLLKDADYKWGIVPMPAGPAGNVQDIGQSAMVAFKASKHPDAAARLVTFLTNKENSKKLSAYFVSSRESLLNADIVHAASPRLPVSMIKQIIDSEKDGGRIQPVAKTGGAASAVLDSAIDKYIYTPDADISAGLKQVCKALEPALKGQG